MLIVFLEYSFVLFSSVYGLIVGTAILVMPYLQVYQMNSVSPFTNEHLNSVYKYGPAVVTYIGYAFLAVDRIVTKGHLILNILFAAFMYVLSVDPSLMALEFI